MPIEFTRKSTCVVFALYLARSREIRDEKPTWSVCGLMMRLEDLKKLSHSEGE